MAVLDKRVESKEKGLPACTQMQKDGTCTISDKCPGRLNCVPYLNHYHNVLNPVILSEAYESQSKPNVLMAVYASR